MTSKLGLTCEGLASASFSVTRKLAVTEYGADSRNSIFCLGRCDYGAGSLALALDLFLFRRMYRFT